MNKLSPKPSHHVKKKTWADLDRMLLANFNETPTDTPSLTIELSDFEMSKSEIISEAHAQGYLVKDNNDGYLVFK